MAESALAAFQVPPLIHHSYLVGGGPDAGAPHERSRKSVAVTGPRGFPTGRTVGEAGASGGPQTVTVAVTAFGAPPAAGSKANVTVDVPGAADVDARNVKVAGANAGAARTADVGVTVTLQPLRDAQFWDAYNRSQYECALLQGSAFSLDPAFVGTLWLADKTATIGWTNKEYSQTLAKVSSIAETKARLEWIRKMQQIFMADLPVIGVISPGFHVAHRSDVDGFIWSATNTIRYQRMVRG